jgi:hypothetical protein
MGLSPIRLTKSRLDTNDPEGAISKQGRADHFPAHATDERAMTQLACQDISGVRGNFEPEPWLFTKLFRLFA